jgi:predicted site-specific integrase-resolvase
MATTMIGSREACKRLGIARSTLNYWMLKGLIKPAQTIPGPNATAAHLWFEADIERLEAERAAS